MVILIILCSCICIYYFLFGEIDKNNRLYVSPINLDLFFLFFLSLSLLFLMTSNRTGYDAISYSRFFGLVKSFGTNFYGDTTYQAFYLLINFITRFVTDITYPEFQALILSFLAIFIIYPFLFKNSHSIVAVLSLYVLSGVYASDGMQFKNFIAVALVLFASRYVICEEPVFWKFYILLLVAICFQFSVVVYVFFPLVHINYFRRITPIFPIIGVLVYLISFLTGPALTSNLLLLLSKLPFMKKLMIYSTSFSGIRSVFPVLIYILILMMLLYFRKFKLQLSRKSFYFLEFMIQIWRIQGLIVPFLIIANAPYRLFRNLYLLVFIAAINVILELPKKSYKRVISVLILIGIALIIFYYPILLKQDIDIYTPVYESNSYFWEE